MSNPDFISGLVATADPVARRRLSVEFLALCAVAGVQLVGASYFYGPGALDKALMLDANRSIFKATLLGISAISFAVLALWSLAPGAKRIGPLLSAVVGVAALLSFIGFDRQLGGSMAATFAPQHGMRCLFSILFLALPVTLVLSLLMMRGASTQPNRTAMLIGLAGGTWGAFTYALQCPFVSLYYLGAWYLGGIAVVALVARIVLPRVAKW